MSSSLVKFFGKQSPGKAAGASTDQRVYWNRAERDGLPFIGANPPMLTDEEYEERVTRVAYPQNGYFDSLDPIENAAYMEIIDGVLNGWYQLIHLQRFWQRTTKHYIEWSAYYMQDGSRMSQTMYKNPGVQNSNDVNYLQSFQ